MAYNNRKSAKLIHKYFHFHNCFLHFLKTYFLFYCKNVVTFSWSFLWIIPSEMTIHKDLKKMNLCACWTIIHRLIGLNEFLKKRFTILLSHLNHLISENVPSEADTGGAGTFAPPLNLEFFVPIFRIASQSQ